MYRSTRHLPPLLSISVSRCPLDPTAILIPETRASANEHRDRRESRRSPQYRRRVAPGFRLRPRRTGRRRKCSTRSGWPCERGIARRCARATGSAEAKSGSLSNSLLGPKLDISRGRLRLKIGRHAKPWSSVALSCGALPRLAIITRDETSLHRLSDDGSRWESNGRCAGEFSCLSKRRQDGREQRAIRRRQEAFRKRGGFLCLLILPSASTATHWLHFRMLKMISIHPALLYHRLLAFCSDSADLGALASSSRSPLRVSGACPQQVRLRPYL